MFNYVRIDIGSRQRGVFIHVPRCAGTSISRFVYPWASRMFSSHATAMMVQEAVGSLVWSKLFTFGIVRNPWERLLSWWKTFINYTERGDLPKYEFPDFLEQNFIPLANIAHCGWLLGEGTWSQKLWLADSHGEIIVDHIARFEKLDEEMKWISEKLEINKEWQSLVKNSSSGSNLTNFYDQKLIDLVAQRCQWEIERFDYSF